MTLRSLRVHTLDVFTTKRFAGNPLAVVEIPDDSNNEIAQDTKHNIAREFNLSETVILHGLSKGDCPERRIDIFTPFEELPFAGHPTIGALCFWASQDESLEKGNLLTKAGPIPFVIGRAAGSITASAVVPHNVHTHGTLLSAFEIRPLQPSLGQRIDKEPKSVWPLVSITKGMTFALIDIASMDELAALTRAPLKPEVKLDERWTHSFIGYYYYFRELESDDAGATVLHTRMIEPEIGEDPVTGSAACALSAYLALETFKASDTREALYRIIQGEHMGRPGSPKITVIGTSQGSIDKIVLSGQAVQVMRGSIEIDT